MKQVARKIVTFVFFVLLLMPVVLAADQSRNTQAGPMTIWQARRTIKSASYHSVRSLRDRGTIDGNSIRFTSDTLEFDTTGSKAGAQHFKLDLKTLESVSAKCSRGGTVWACSLRNERGQSLPSDSLLFLIWQEGPWSYACSPDPNCSTDRINTAKPFVAGIHRLRAFANASGEPLRTYTQQAAAWRALTAKPPLPEEVRVQRLLAEGAVKENKPQEALNRYETGLELYPTWPQGYFNAALIAAELGFHADAAEHMQSYLELVPDSPDAQSARDQIAVWKYKAKEIK